MQLKSLHPKNSLRSVLLILLLFVAGITNLWAYSFSSIAPSGQLLYYTITSSIEHTVMVTHPNSTSSGGNGNYEHYYYNDPYYGYTKPAGDLVIPFYVEYHGISYSVTAIDSFAFGTLSSYGQCSCTNLTSVSIPSSVQTIGSYAFAYCINLVEITSLTPSSPTVSSNAFNSVNKDIPVFIPMGSIGTYQNAPYWNEFSNFVDSASFSATCDSGQTLYFTVTDNANHYVEVMFPGNSISAPWEGYDKPIGNLVIPEIVEFCGIPYTVKGIQFCAFFGCSGLTQVTISENISYIYGQAFWNCPNLETVYFNAVDCNLMQTRTGYNPYTYYSVFSSDENGSAPNLTRVSIGSGVQNIPDYAFKNAEDVYQRLVIPASVTNIGHYAFDGCNSMVQMVIQGNGLQTIGNYAFYDCSALQTALNLPNSVVSLGSYSFYGCAHIPSLTIGESMASIGSRAFWNCPAMATVNFNAVNCTSMNSGSSSVFNSGTTPITTLNIGPNVTNIPDYAFYNSPNATNNLVFPEGLLNIGQYAFYDGGFTGELIIPNLTGSIGQRAFYNCDNIDSLIIGGGEIEQYAFSDCDGIISVMIGSGEIGQYAFNSCDEITSLTIGEGVTSIGGKAFWDCPQLQTVNFNAVNCTTMNTDAAYSVFNEGSSNGGETPINTLTIGNNVTNIPDYAFYNSPNATNTLPLPNGLLNIGTYAFYNCSGMTGALAIPNTVTNVGQYAFYHCSGFDGSLTLSNSLNTINPYTFCGCTGFIETLSIPNSVLTIAEHAFEDCSSFTGSLAIHDALTSIGEAAFKGCSNIAELTLGEGLSTIGGSAFWNCPQMHAVHFNPVNCTTMNTSNAYSVFNVGTTSSGATPIVTLTIGENVTRIPDYAFRNSISATSKIVIPNATTYIGTYAFYGFRSNELTIGEGVDEIGGYAFWYCPNLQTVHFNAIDCSSMKTQTGSGSNIVYYSVFNSGTNSVSSPSITLLTIGKKVQTIPDYAFKNCSSADCKLLFPNTLTTIGVQAFYEGNSFIGDLVIPNSVTSLGEYAFYHCNGFDGSLVIGSGISTINQYTFADCTGFTGALIIGRSVESIGNYSFRNCSGFSTAISEHPTPPTALNTSFNNMNYAIPVHVPYAMVPAYQAATGWSLFSYFREQFVFDQLDNDLWSDTQNWYSFELPTANDVVCVNSNCQMDMDAEVLHLYVLNLNDALTINNGETLSVTYGIGTLQPSQLVIDDGGQLVNPVSNAYGTVQRNINGYGSSADGWYSLATPIYEGTETDVLSVGTYDLFYYDEPTHYWMNEKIADNGFVSLEPAQGYLYANQAQQTIAFAGQLNASNADFSLPVTHEGSPLAGYTLVGNPYTNNLSINDLKLNGTPLTTYYRIEGEGNLVAYTAAAPIRPGEGFLVMAPEGGTLTFSPLQNQGRNFNMPDNKNNGGLIRGFRTPTHGDLTNINAYSSDVTYTITATANPINGGTVTGSGTYDQGVTCTLVATANEGYNFVNWTENGNQASTEASYSFTVNGDRTLQANFVSNQSNSYIIIATANPSNGGSVTGSGSYEEGSTCTLTATANAGYVFNNWTLNGTVVSSNATYSFIVTETAEYVANFEEEGPTTNHWTPIGGTQYNMTVSGIIFINDVEQTVTTLEVGAFCGDECRGSMLPEFFPPSNQYVVSLTIVSNQQSGETITFKLYDHITNQELDLQCVNNITFVSNAIIGAMGDWFHFTFNSEVSVTATVDPEGAGSVTGTGSYMPGATATLFATANDGYAFSGWSIGGEIVSTDNPYTFTVTSTTELVAHFDRQQLSNLSSGWNWWSTYIEQQGIDGLTMLEQSLGHNGLIIKTQVPYVQNYYPQTSYDYWFGSLTNVGLTNEAGYQISVSANCPVMMTGAVANASEHPITIQSGWNWIGYPVAVQQSLSTGLSGFTPTANDLIKGQGSSATYYANYGWFPTSFALTPGQSYMYYSNASQAQTLTYHVGRSVEFVAESPIRVLTNNIHAHASNIVVIATVTVDGEERQNEELELGAFVDGECRGSAVLQYFEPTNRWYAVLTVSGEEGETVTFAAINRRNGTINAKSTEVITYRDNAIVGSLDEPYVVHFGTAESLHIYPNPVERNTAFSIDIPINETITEVVIVNTIGETIFHNSGKMNNGQMLGIKTSGVYMVKVICHSGNIYMGRLIVR